MKNQVQLITYVDRLGGGGIHQLQQLLTSELSGLFGGVHLLPFYFPIDGADAGFDPADHTLVDHRLGDWGHVRSLTQQLDVMADVIVNHMSSDSPQFQDYSAKGSASASNGLFLTMDAGQWRAPAAVDHLHQPAGRHRCRSPCGSGLSARHPADLGRCRHPHGAAGRGGLRHQEGR
jgi:Alpha amylase, catalytic domain